MSVPVIATATAAATALVAAVAVGPPASLDASGASVINITGWSVLPIEFDRIYIRGVPAHLLCRGQSRLGFILIHDLA